MNTFRSYCSFGTRSRAIFLAFVAFFGATSMTTLRAEADCPGRIPNPVTDVCWSCMLPIVIGKNVALGKAPEDAYTPDTDASPLCVCGENVNIEGGVNLSFWEPLRTAEIVRHGWCSPSLGGIVLADNKGLTRTPDHGRGRNGRHTRFANVHWYVSPWLFILEAVSDIGCLEQAPWDLAYLSELDPLWDDTLASFLLAPDAALFANPAAQAACAADCLAANVKKPDETLYWCSGCRGGVFPLSGWTASSASWAAEWELLAHRFALKLSREGVLWSAHGKKGACGPYWRPILQKEHWKTQLLYPARSTEKTVFGTCCQPLGRSTLFWDRFKTFAPGGEDGALLLFRHRDCCMRKSLTSYVLPGRPGPDSP